MKHIVMRAAEGLYRSWSPLTVGLLMFQKGFFCRVQSRVQTDAGTVLQTYP